MAACRRRRSFDPRAGRACSRGRSRLARRSQAGGCHPPTCADRNPMALSMPRFDDDEQRLAALWEHTLGDDASNPETADDTIAALFSSSRESAEHRPPCASVRRTRRSSAHRSGHGSGARMQRFEWTGPQRLLGAAPILVAVLVVVFVAPRTLTGSTDDNAAVKGRPQGGRIAPAIAPERPSRAEQRTVRSQPARQRRQPAVKPRHQAKRASRTGVQVPRGDRQLPARPQSPHHPRPLDVTPRTQPRVPPRAAPSSACDEFPPC